MDKERFFGDDTYGKPKTEYVDFVSVMTDEQLFEETKNKLWLSAFANNNPRSDYHWHVDVIYETWSDRGKTEQYSKAFNIVSKR